MGLLYDNCYLNSNDFGVIIFQNLGCLVFVFCVHSFSGPRDFINRRGLVIPGGDYVYLLGVVPCVPSRSDAARASIFAPSSPIV